MRLAYAYGMAQEKPNWEKVPPRDWGEEQAYRTALEVRRLRGKRTAQWLADEASRLGYPMTRAVISDLEVGRRRYVTTAELVALALALNTAPVALMYPDPYREQFQPFPTPEGEEPFTASKFWAAQWFSGLSETVSVDINGELITLGPLERAANYDDNVKELAQARRVGRLAERRQEKLVALKMLRAAKEERKSLPDNDPQIVALQDEIASILVDIADFDEAIRDLGGSDGR